MATRRYTQKPTSLTDATDVSDDVDWSQAFRLNLKTRRVKGDFPAWVIAALGRRAKELGVTRQSLIKLWIAERLQ